MTCELIGWCALTPEAQAAWAQAVLTVLTFIASLFIAARANAKSEEALRKVREEGTAREALAAKRRAKALAIPLVGILADMATDIENFLLQYGGAVTADLPRLKQVIEMPTFLEARTDLSHELGDASEPVQDFIMVLTQLSVATNAAIDIRDAGEDEPEEWARRIEVHLRQALDAARAAQAAIVQMFQR